MIMNKNTINSLAISIFFLMVLLSCKGGKKETSETEEVEVLPENIVELREDQIKLAEIETGAVELRTLSGTLKVNGTVTTTPQNLATVCFPMGGFVKNTSLVTGSMVKKGQTLAVIENQDFVDIQQNYLEARNKLEFAETEYKRHNELYKEDVYSQQNVQQVTVEYKSLKAQVKALEQKLILIGINPGSLQEDNISSAVPVLSPISGYLKAVNINLGKYVAPSDVLFEIVNSSNLLLELTLFEKDADKVSENQNIRFFINNEAEQHNAHIYQTGKSIGLDKTYKVYAQVTDICKNILPGMYVNAVIETSGNKVTALPSDAIVSFDDKFYIFVFERNKEEDGKPFTEYRMVQVQKGISDNGYTEVVLPKDFITDKSKVVTKGAYNLLSAKKNAGEMAC
jgi:cobalt-zinc-cadmium efflux system membrane fusion protein